MYLGRGGGGALDGDEGGTGRMLDMGKLSLFLGVGFMCGLGSCAGASHSWVGGDQWSIACKRNAGNCYSEAAKVCPSGFDVVDAQGQHGAIAQTNYSTGQTFVTPTYSGQMLVRCRAPAPK